MNFFEPVVAKERFHQHFKALLDPQRTVDRDEFLRWAAGFPDRDGKLVQEFQITFNTVFWEVYLFAVFKELGFKFNWSHTAPDFLLTHDDMTVFNVEAVTANAAVGKPNEWEKSYASEDFAQLDIDKLNKEAMIRLSNAIQSKYKKFKADYAALQHVHRRPFVVAVGPFEQPFFNHQYNRPIKAVLYDHYVDEPAYMANPSAFPNGPPSVKLNFVTKENGTDIELGIFNDDRMREISAVIFSCTATWGKVNSLAPEIPSRRVIIDSSWISAPDGRIIRRVGTPSQIGESITDGLQIYHNPYAMYPLSPKIFRRRGIVQNFFDEMRGEWIEEEINQSLLFRLTTNIELFNGPSEEVQKEGSQVVHFK